MATDDKPPKKRIEKTDHVKPKKSPDTIGKPPKTDKKKNK